jgi:hypothetical protein
MPAWRKIIYSSTAIDGNEIVDVSATEYVREYENVYIDDDNIPYLDGNWEPMTFDRKDTQKRLC